MATATKKGISPGTIFVILVLVAAAAIIPWPSIIGTSSTGDTRVVEITVEFTPSPRRSGDEAQVIVTVGDKTGKLTPLRESPWGETITVQAGTLVTVHAGQPGRGSVTCSIKVNGDMRYIDVTDDEQPAICVVTA